ncbi:MAG: hypothetical protein OEW58_09535 [Gammaproteobacteria bacterium]|nr:hypothetical protein [Gammaproteobacteria bacterium]
MTISNKGKLLLQQLGEPHTQIITQLLNNPNELVWFQARPLLLCADPLLTLEMAVKRVSDQSLRTMPDTFVVLKALSYAWDKFNEQNEEAAKQA